MTAKGPDSKESGPLCFYFLGGKHIDKTNISRYTVNIRKKEVFPMHPVGSIFASLACRKEITMKKLACIIAALLLFGMAQAFAESEQIILPTPQPTDSPLAEFPQLMATNVDECLHIYIYAVSDILTRCSYRDSSQHVITEYYEVDCFDCHAFPRDVIVSETDELHTYVQTGYNCDADNYQHTTWHRCTGCKHTTETTVFCRGVHETLNSNKIIHDEEES